MKTVTFTIATACLLTAEVVGQEVKTPQWVSIPTAMMKEFKESNLLREDFDAPGQMVLEEEFSIGNEILSFSDRDLIPFEDIFTSSAEYYLDGIKQPVLPEVTIFRNAADKNVLISKSNGALKRAAKVDPTTGETMTLIPMEEESQFFVEVMPEDTDIEKLSEFSFGESEEAVDPRYRFLRSVDRSVRERLGTKKRSLAVACDSFDVIELAVAYENLFCKFFGGSDGANAAVQAIVADISVKYQQEGLCTKVSLSYLEGHCIANNPYTAVFRTNGVENSICDRNDPISQLRIFQDYWRNNRQQVRRDVAHLFHGYNHVSNTIGCAYIGVLCNTFSGYAVNEITYGGNNNQRLWNVLVAHELGHNAGTRHDTQRSGFIMNPGVCDCQTFSEESITQMRSYMDRQTCLDEPPAEPGTPSPTARPAASPTSAPVTLLPTPGPTDTPSPAPSPIPSKAPITSAPTRKPTPVPSPSPSKAPITSAPTMKPTPVPSPSPSKAPVTSTPTQAPTPSPTRAPTPSPSSSPSTVSPTSSPTLEPTRSPVTPSPTTGTPTVASGNPSATPTTESPTIATKKPTSAPTIQPSLFPTTLEPTEYPTAATTKVKTPPTQVGKTLAPTVAPTSPDDDDCIKLGEPLSSAVEARQCFNKFPAARCNYFPSKVATCQDGEPACLRSTELDFSNSTYTCGDDACFTGSPEGTCSERFASCSRTSCCDGLRCLYGIVCF